MFARQMASPAEAYRTRRARLSTGLSRPVVIFAGHAAARNYPANVHPFRPGSWYTYFGGAPIEHAALLIEPGSDGDAGCGLYRPDVDPDDLVWIGAPTADSELAAIAGLSTAGVKPLAALAARTDGRDVCAVAPPFVDTLAHAARLGLRAVTDDEAFRLIDLRLVKDEFELSAMRTAAEIGMDAQRAAFAALRPGATEADLHAEFMAVLIANEVEVPYNAIITVHGEILHAVGYSNVCEDGQLLLLDGSAESPSRYANDITRTAPVSGRFTPVQRHLYETVRRALNECCAACTAGRRYRDVHDLAGRIICEGLVQAELLRGDPGQLAERRAQTLFFTHGVGHLIGLDVHDMRDFADLAGYAPGRSRPTQFGDKFLRLDRDLAAGVCTTIEPGLYLSPGVWQRDDLTRPFADAVDRPKVEALLRDNFGGIRLEHTICVRASGGPEILTEDLPTAPDEVVELVGISG
jgi:Xaa-Pro aminopeptidase